MGLAGYCLLVLGGSRNGDLLPDRGTLVPCRECTCYIRSKHEAVGAKGHIPCPTHAQSSSQITSQMPRQITILWRSISGVE